MAVSDIASFVFNEILRIDPSSTLIRGDIGRDIIFVLVIPAAILLLIFYEIMKPLLGDHTKLRILFGIGGLGAVVYLGLYELLVQWSIILFLVWVGLFGLSRVYMKTAGARGHGAIRGIFGWAGGLIARPIRGAFTHLDVATETRIGTASRMLVATIRALAEAQHSARVSHGGGIVVPGTGPPANVILRHEERIAELQEQLGQIVAAYGSRGRDQINRAVRDAVEQHALDRSFIGVILPNADSWRAMVRGYWPYG